MNKAMMLSLTVSTALLAGCAGSANHDVLSANQAGDEGLSCRQIDDEIVRAQVVIDGVNEDKEDISGADVVDGVLWFPFNLIAKHGNYKAALEAADSRIGRLQTIKREKGCGGMSVAQKDAAVTELTDKLAELTRLHESGMLSDDEYSAAKRKVLGL
ncbi:SHOCT domain-containing protein [Marinobacterium litorale]|uniref:SHOCT domain-containing protein n=1 Tax=Marinobacterium litorale TaxID=404770 RepID=UPI0003FAC019|nr:SHOCT domain-containing protein [Marinobacterium litorale]